MMPSNSKTGRPLRLWPGMIFAVLQFVCWLLVPLLLPDQEIFGVLGGVVGALGILVWWLFFSRAAWSDRLGAIILMIAAGMLTAPVLHISIAGAGMGNLFYIMSVASMTFALVVGAMVGRRWVTAVLILAGCGMWTLLRTDGIMGAGGSQFAWRWSPTAEDRLLAQPDIEPKVAAPAPSVAEVTKDKPAAVTDKEKKVEVPAAKPAPPDVSSAIAEWPGFRGPDRDGVVHGVQIQTDWSTSPPVQIWRRPIGPGWSSFAVQGDVLYTQEQRGDDEIVAAYKVSTGEPVWRHRDRARFYESNGGPGPRGTPTLAHGRVYAFGATGILNVLDARTGAALWSRNAASDTGRKVPDWGFASSPLVLDDKVVVAVSGTLAAYDLSGGKPRWIGPAHGGSYSSPQLTTVDGIPQIILLHGAGVTSVDPSTGKALWEYEWSGSAIVQPAVIGGGDIVINTIAMTGGLGTRRISVTHGSNDWTVQERWTSNGLKPYYNDFVIHKGYAFGFDGSILSCIDLEDGKRKWKGGRYGNGQMVLLPEQDVLLVLSEDGELALVKATPDQFTEIAKLPALQGKTWNHPVLVGNVLLVRNGEEMAAFRMPLAGRSE